MSEGRGHKARPLDWCRHMHDTSLPNMRQCNRTTVMCCRYEYKKKVSCCDTRCCRSWYASSRHAWDAPRQGAATFNVTSNTCLVFCYCSLSGAFWRVVGTYLSRQLDLLAV
jgi:hypothetical protein